MTFEEFTKTPRPIVTAAGTADISALSVQNCELRSRVTSLLNRNAELQAALKEAQTKLAKFLGDPRPIVEPASKRLSSLTLFSDPHRDRLLLIFDHKCFFCGCVLDQGTITIDHLFPKSKGGGNRIENKAAACYRCNQEKKDRLPTPEENQRCAYLHAEFRRTHAKRKARQPDADAPTHLVQGRIVCVSRAFGNS